ncbi:MAG: helix-turn-helix domain-containing protein [Mangrovicoccus sp.]
MLEIPVAWVVTILAGIAAAAVLRAPHMPTAARWLQAGALSGFAMVGLLLGLRLSYGWAWAGLAQPFLALAIMPLVYLGFAALTQEPPYPWRKIGQSHGLAAGFAMLAVAGSRLALADLLIPVQTGFYLWRLWLLWRCPPESFVHVTSGQARLVRACLAAVILLCGMFMLTDLAIFLRLLIFGPEALRSSLGIATTILTLAVVLSAALGLPWLLARSEAKTASAAPTEKADLAASPEDLALFARLEAMLAETSLYTDSQLTLARMARRLGVPSRSLSQAVNRAGQSNFSRYINAHRVAHAQKLLLGSDLPVTEIMLEAGFVSKSSFNSSFREITGQTPSAYRAAAKP